MQLNYEAKEPKSVKAQRIARHSSQKKAKKRFRYKLKNWSEYNKSLIERGSLTVWLSEEVIEQWAYQGPRKRGGQMRYSDLAIQTALGFKHLFRLPLRQTEGFLRSLFQRMHLVLEAPDYSTLSRRQGGLVLDLPPKRGNGPLDVVVDSTGLKVYGEGEWKVRQHGWSKRRTWRKLHLALDAESQQIVAWKVTTNGVDDAACVEPLLQEIEAPVETFCGDGAYDKKKVYRSLARRKIAPLIPPRQDARISQHGNSSQIPLARDETLRAIRRQGRASWKRTSGYHRRSLGETAISRWKRTFGSLLASRTFPNQKVEGSLKCILLNRMTHLGRPDSYKVAV